jgi:hypothetical protein
VHWLEKFWFVIVLIPFLAAVIGVLLHRLRGDSKLDRSGVKLRNKAQDGKQR